MGRIEADIALESWLFGFRPCSGQGQFTLTYLLKVLHLCKYNSEMLVIGISVIPTI